MKYDHNKVRASNRLRAKTNLENAIKEAMNSGLCYGELITIFANVTSEVAEKSKEA